MNINKLWSAALFMFLAAVELARADGSTPTNLIALTQTALLNNPAMKAAASREDGARGTLSEVKSMNWPKLSVRSSVMRGDNPVYVFGSLLEQQQFGPQNFAISPLNNPDYQTNIKNALVVEVPLFTGLELSSQEKMGKIQLEQAKDGTEGMAQNIRYQTIEGTLRVLLHRDLLKSIQDRIGSSREEIESARKLNARGLVLGSDFYAAQATLSGLETQKAQLEKSLEAAKEQLAILIGEPVNEAALKLALADRAYMLDSEEDLMARALQGRADLKAANKQQSLATVAARQAGRGFWPKIGAFGSIETNTEDFSSNPSNRMIGIKSDFPLGDPTAFVRKKRAQANEREAAEFKKSAEDRARMEVIQALRGTESAAATLPSAKETMERAQKALELFRPLYREGRQSIMEVLRAEEGLARAEAGFRHNLYQLHATYAALQLATGTMSDEAVAEINRRLEVR